MAINSKAKGNTFERKVSKILSDRFCERTGLEVAFRRNIDSGSFFGGRNQIRASTHDLDKATFGDIVTPVDFAFTVECKHYKTPPTFASIMKQNNKQLDTWLEQAEQDAESSGKKLVVIAKFNNVDEMAVVKELFGTMKSVINYKEYSICTLEDFLAQDTDHFFDQ
jgi:hypothetical protein